MQSYPSPYFQPPPFYPPPRQQESKFSTYIIISIFVILGVILFMPMDYYYFGEQYMQYMKNDYLIKRVYDEIYKKEPSPKTDMFVKESWSLFDFLMLSILTDTSINVIFDSFNPSGVKLGDSSLYLDKDNSLKSTDIQSDVIINSINLANEKKNELSASEGFI